MWNLEKPVPCRRSHPEVFLGKGILKICSKFTGEHPCRRVISIKLKSNFVEITLRHGCSPVNLLHIFRTPLDDCSWPCSWKFDILLMKPWWIYLFCYPLFPFILCMYCMRSIHLIECALYREILHVLSYRMIIQLNSSRK